MNSPPAAGRSSEIVHAIAVAEELQSGRGARRIDSTEPGFVAYCSVYPRTRDVDRL
jgi:hypothetical protein